MIRVFIFVIITGFFSSYVYAQASLVPSHHPVYDWLYHQRISGSIPSYNYESLPLKRNEILVLLKKVERSNKLSSTQNKTLQSYIREFDSSLIKEERTHKYFASRDSVGTEIDWESLKWKDDQEFHLINLHGDEHIAWLDLAIGNRAMSVSDGDNSYSSTISVINRARLVAGYKSTFGLHFGYDFVTPSLSNIETFFYDNYYSSNWWIWRRQVSGEKVGNNLSHLESYATYSPFNAMDLSIGKGNLKIGTGDNNNLLFSRNSIPTTWLKLNVGNRWVKFVMVHGTLSWPTVTIQDPNYSNLTTKNAPQRFVRLNQLKFQPFEWVDFHFFEMINYGNRGFEVDYLHPFNILSMAQGYLQDQDNTMGGGMIVLRPFLGLEMSAEILIDDMLDPSEIFRITRPEISRFGRKFTLQAAPSSDFRIFSEYNKIDPFVYSHPYGLNAHTQFETSLGSQLPPNSDKITFGGRYLLKYRSWIDIRMSRVRHAKSIYDEDGNLQFNAGDNVNVGRNQGEDASWLFLDGDSHRWLELEIDASWEIRRAWVLKSRFEKRWMQTGNQLNDLQIFWLDLIIGM